MSVLFSVMETVLLVTALSLDAFVASFAYGTNKITIPKLSIFIISAVCTGMLFISLMVGSIISPYISYGITKTICFSIMFILGIIKLFDSSIKAFIRKNSHMKKKIQFSLFNMKFILNVYADPEKADKDLSRTLSSKEATSLAIALSLDGLAVGFGVGLASVNMASILFCSFFTGAIAVLLGDLIGKKIAEKIPLDLSWISGVLLMILAFLKL